MPRTEPIELSFFETAPVTRAWSWDVNVPADQFWQDLTSDRPLHWCRGLKINWTSPRPFGVGTTRHMNMLGALRGDELFFLWDEGVRFAFHLTSASLPLFKRFGEYYEVQPTGDGSCRFVWKLAAEPTALGRAGGPVNSLLFARLFADTTRYVESLNR